MTEYRIWEDWKTDIGIRKVEWGSRKTEI